MPTQSRRAFVRTTSGLLALSAVPAPLRAMSLPAPATPVSPTAAPNAATLSDPELTGRPLPDLRRPLPDAPDRRVGVALVGLGAYALNQIAPNLANTQHARLAAVVSGNADKASAVATAYGLASEHVYTYDTFDRIADDETVDVVYVILPNAFHRTWTERAFAAGKHVLCEKPMAGTVEDCRAMIAAGEAAGRWLMIGYRAQFDPYNRRAIDLVQGGAIGTPQIVVADHGRLLELDVLRDQWRADKSLALGGSLYDIGIYSVNGARYLLGEEPAEVTATFLGRSGRPEVSVEEGVEWQMTFPSGARALCSSSYLVNQAKRIHVQGSEGEVTLDPATDYYVRNLFVTTSEGRREITIPAPNQFAAMLDEMALAVREDREPGTPGAEGLRDVEILEAIYQAAETGRAVAV